MKNKYLAMIKVGDKVKMNSEGVNCFGDLMLNVPCEVVKVYSDEHEYKECDNRDNCSCHLRYNIKACDNAMSLDELVFSELDIIKLK